MKEFLNVSQALADASRLRIVEFLRAGELCVCQIVQVLGLAPSTVSKHLSILEQAGLVTARKESRWMHYARPDRPTALVADALRWADRHADGSRQCMQDLTAARAALRAGAQSACAIYQTRKVPRGR